MAVDRLIKLRNDDNGSLQRMQYHSLSIRIVAMVVAAKYCSGEGGVELERDASM